MASPLPKGPSGLNLDASAASTPFTDEETRVLLRSDLTKLLRDSAVARLVLSRYEATVAAHRQETLSVRRELEHALARAQLSSSPLTAAVLALSSLRPEERPQVFTAHASNLLEVAREAAAAAHQERLAASQVLKRVLLELETLHTAEHASAGLDLSAVLAQVQAAISALSQTASLAVVEEIEEALEAAAAAAFPDSTS